MRSPRHRTSPSLNILTPEFLARLRELEEPASVGEAELAGPWQVEEGARGFAVLRDWESGKRGDVPESVWIEEETALLAAVAVGAAGREPLFRLREEEGAEGFAVEAAGAKGMEAGRVVAALPPGDGRGDARAGVRGAVAGGARAGDAGGRGARAGDGGGDPGPADDGGVESREAAGAGGAAPRWGRPGCQVRGAARSAAGRGLALERARPRPVPSPCPNRRPPSSLCERGGAGW